MAEAKKSTKKAVSKPDKEQEDGINQESSITATEAVVETEEAVDTADKPKATAKAGKRSAKAMAESEEKATKEARKQSDQAEEAKDDTKPAKKAVKPARSRLERRSKNFRKSAELLKADTLYKVAEAIELATKTSPVKFDATVEMHFRLNVDPRQADQNIRDTIVLPGGTGKTVRVAVFADVDDVAKAKKAGADVAGNEEFLQQLDKGTLDFDVLIATPMQMAKLGKYAKLLGPKGLMPNPKSGTVTTDVAKAVQEAKAGKVEYRVDSTGIVHLGIGKVSFGADKLTANARAVIDSIKGNKPSSIKTTYMNSVFVTTSMGPSIKLDIADVNS